MLLDQLVFPAALLTLVVALVVAVIIESRARAYAGDPPPRPAPSVAFQVDSLPTVTSGPVAVGSISVCLTCGRIILRHTFGDTVFLWDPSFVQRRFIRSIVAPQVVRAIGFTAFDDPRGAGRRHVCGPADVARHAELVRTLRELDGDGDAGPLFRRP